MYLVIDLLQLFVLLQCHCLIVSFFIYRVYHVYRVFQLRLIHMFHINRRNNSSQSIILTNWLQLMCTQSSHSHIHIRYVITGWNFRHFFQLYRDLYHIKHLWLLVTTHSLSLLFIPSFIRYYYILGSLAALLFLLILYIIIILPLSLYHNYLVNRCSEFLF